MVSKRLLSGVLVVAVAVAGQGCQTGAGTGALVGGGVGAGAGALIDHKNPWRGALIGAAAGGLIGYAIGNEIDKQKQSCATTAYRENRVVVREISDQETGDRYRVRAAPTNTPTRVQTTVQRYNPNTGMWEVQSESIQNVN